MEWVTLVRLIGGTLVLWFMGSSRPVAGGEGEPGRLATAAFGLGVVWSGVWLLSASSTRRRSPGVHHADPPGRDIAGVLAR